MATEIMSTSVTVDKNDVIAIVVSEAEERLTIIYDANRKAATAAEKRADAQMNDLRKQAASDNRASADKAVGLIQQAHAALGLSTKVKATVKAEVSLQAGYMHGIGQNVDGPSVVVVLGYEISGEVRDSASKSINVTEQYASQLAIIQAAKAEEKKLLETAIEAKQGLSRLATYERKARATLARRSLSDTEEGRAILANIVATDLGIPLLKALPSS